MNFADEFYRSVIDRFPTGFVLLFTLRDASGAPDDFEIRSYNPAARKILDGSERDLKGVRIRELGKDGKVVEELLPVLRRVASGGGTEVTTLELVKRKMWLKVTVDSPGDDLLAVFLSDITTSVSRFIDLDTFFNISLDLFTIADTEGRFIKVSPSCASILGYRQDEMEGHLFTEFLHPEDLRVTKTANERLGAHRSQVVDYTNRFLHKDGGYRSLEWGAQSDGERIYSVARDVTDRMVWEKKIEYLSYHDALTGLYNRRFIEEEIRRLDTPRNLPITVIFGDVDRLKLVNDAFGHEAGDELIVKAANIMVGSCRPEDLIARWGGDEFILFLPRTQGEDAAKIVARIQGNSAGVQVNAIDVSISFGTATKTSPNAPIAQTIQEAEHAMYKAKAHESERNRIDIIDTVITALYRRNRYEEQHAKRVSALCRKTAQAMGLEEEETRKMSLAGLLHDIGKVAVSMEILEKTGQLDDDEWSQMRKHAEKGYQIVGMAGDMSDIGNAILSHHERPDGKGYPRGIRWEMIPMMARIIAVADSYDTMTGPSVYRKRMTKAAAIEEIRRCEGTQFDPVIAEIFIDKVIASGVSPEVE